MTGRSIQWDMTRARDAPPPRVPEVYVCSVCKAPACYADGRFALRGQEGTWFCPEHAPAAFRVESVRAEE